jgi:hypothetical protein
MGRDSSRRCALWVSPEILAAAHELADLLGVDVDTFIESAVLVLHEQEASEGRLRARAAAAKKASNGHVIPMTRDRSVRR